MQTSGAALESMELYGVAFGAHVPDAAARLARVRAAGVPAGLSAKLLAAVAAWDWALGGGSARECSDVRARNRCRRIADRPLSGIWRRHGRRRAGPRRRRRGAGGLGRSDDRSTSTRLALLDLRGEHLARLDLVAARRARGSRGLPARSARAAPRPLRTGFAFRRLRGRAPRASADRARRPSRRRGPPSPPAGTQTRHPTPMPSFAAPRSSCCSPSTAGMKRSSPQTSITRDCAGSTTRHGGRGAP